jgi:gentisate 1,2-dioxygenase
MIWLFLKEPAYNKQRAVDHEPMMPYTYAQILEASALGSEALPKNAKAQAIEYFNWGVGQDFLDTISATVNRLQKLYPSDVTGYIK